jgi:hypothetical protein
VSIPQIVYQTIEVNNPQIATMARSDGRLLLLRDTQQQLELKITLDRAKLAELINNLQS